MLKIIDPKYQQYYRDDIEFFMNLMKESSCSKAFPQSFEWDPLSPTYIIAKDQEQGIYGGALLYRRETKELQRTLIESISTFLPYQRRIWSGTLFMGRETLNLWRTQGNSNLIRIFYRDLFKKLCEFGIRKGAGFMCLTLDPIEHLRTKKNGLWPYVVEVQPQASIDGLFHGVLPLSRKTSESYLRLWKSIIPVFQEGSYEK